MYNPHENHMNKDPLQEVAVVGAGRRRPFVGRQRELGTLLERQEEAGAGKGGVVLVAGEPGVGKTRLVQELAEQAAAQGRLVLSGRAYDLDIAPPYLPLAEALGNYVQTCPEDDLRGQLSDGLADIALIVPDVRKRLPDLGARTTAGPDDDRYRLFESVCSFLLTIARSSPQGLLLILDDLHWADQATAQLVVHLARKLAGVPLLLMATYRTVELDRTAPLVDALAELSREGICERMVLGPLSIDDTRALVEQTWGSAAPQAATAALHHKTEGNAFFTQEVLRELQAAGFGPDSLEAGLAGLQVPEGVRQVIGKRLSRLGPQANRLLEACAVLGDGARFEVLAAVCEDEDEVLLNALEEAVATGMLREEGQGYHLSHALIRQTLNDGVLSPRRRRLHLRAAEAIERIHAGSLDPFLGSLALHYRLAAAPTATEKALDYAERAAEAAVAVFAFEEAARHLEAALALIEGRLGDLWLERRAGLLTRVGRLLFESGLDSAKGVACLDEAVKLYKQLGRIEDAAEVHVRLGHYHSGPAMMDIPRALEQLRIAEATLGPQPPGLVQGDLYHALAVAALTGVRTAEGLAASQRAFTIAQELSSESLLARACLVNGAHLMASGQIAEGLLRLEQGWGSACRARQVYVFQLYGGPPGDFLRILGAPREAEVWSRRSLAELDRSHASPVLRGSGLSRLGQVLLAVGRTAEARSALGEIDQVSLGGLTLQTHLLAARVAVADGDWDRAETLARRNREQCQRSGYRQGEWYALDVLAYAQRARGQRQQAEALLYEALAIGIDGGRVLFELTNRAELALLAAQVGQLDGPESHLRRCHEILAGGEDWRGLAGRVTLGEGVAVAAAGRLDEAQQHFERALQTFRDYSMVWDEAEALCLWGAALGTAAGRVQAAEKLACARAVYERIEAGPPWLDAIADLEQRFSPGRHADPKYPDGLTAREVQVLGLLASGESNREIAERLVLSARTIERHVAVIYRKIGARRRADATSYAIHHSLDRTITP